MNRHGPGCGLRPILPALPRARFSEPSWFPETFPPPGQRHLALSTTTLYGGGDISGTGRAKASEEQPLSGRVGFGVCAWARLAGHPAVTLSTFRDIP